MDTSLRRRPAGNHRREKEDSVKKTRDEAPKTTVETEKDEKMRETLLDYQWWGTLIFVTGLTVATRLHKIEIPSQIW